MLDRSDTQVDDAAPLAKLTNLQIAQPSGHADRRRRPARRAHQPAIARPGGTQVANAAPLSQLTNLEWLSLSGTQVGDAAPLAELINLQGLDLFSTQ